MKSTACLSLAVVIVVVLGGVSSKSTAADSNRRVARGFRLGAADRFSHGFGKRTEGSNTLEYLTDTMPDFALPNEEFAEILRSSERLSNMFVQTSVDKNGDGFVSKDELLGYEK